MNTFIKIFGLLFFIISTSAQISPTQISNSSYSVSPFTWPSIFSIGNGTSFGIAWAHKKGQFFMKTFPDNTITALNCTQDSTNDEYVFFSAHSLKNGGFAFLCENFDNKCKTISQVYDENINLVGFINFTNQLDCVGGLAVIPLNTGIMMVGASATQGENYLFGQFNDYNTTLVSNFNIVCNDCTEFGPGTPLGVGLSNGSAVLFYSIKTYGTPVVYQIISPDGVAVTNTTKLDVGYVSTLTPMPNDGFVLESWKISENATLLFFDANGTIYSNYTANFGSGNVANYLPGPAGVLSNGNIAVFANYLNVTSWKYIGQVFNASGAASEQFVISNFTFLENNIEDTYVEVLGLPDDTFVLTWAGIKSNQPVSIQVYAMRYNNNGTPVEFQSEELFELNTLEY